MIFFCLTDGGGCTSQIKECPLQICDCLEYFKDDNKSFSLTARNYIDQFVSKSSGDSEAVMVTEVLLSCQSPTVQKGYKEIL